MTLIKIYLVTLPIFFLTDMIWLGLIAKNFYRQHLGYLMTPQVNWTAAIIFYLLFIAGLVGFVILPALEKNEWSRALLMGAFFGLITYATYDLTNLATVRDWPVVVSIVDMAWGTFLGGFVSVASYWIVRQLRMG